MNMVRQVEAKWTTGKMLFAGSNNWSINGTTNIPQAWSGTILGSNPGFLDVGGDDLRIGAQSPLVDAGAGMTSGPPNFPFPNPLNKPEWLPPQHTVMASGSALPRPHSGPIDIGAYEYDAGGGNGDGGNGDGGTGGMGGAGGGTGGSGGDAGGTGGGGVGGSGGTGGSGGGTGGSGGGTGGSGGGTGGSGGGTGGSGGGTGGSGGDGGDGGDGTDGGGLPDSSGCSCRAAAPQAGNVAWALSLLSLAAFASRRRRVF
ncbi:MAG: hypothetical protein IPM54_01250 [Polyangiaceae bacterium]|nr:hypothetical protein [Polyangiaceae bacterium]